MKTTTLQFRCSQLEHSILKKASEIKGISMTRLIIEPAVEKGKRIIKEREKANE